MSISESNSVPQTPPAEAPGVRLALPVSRPLGTYVLLGLIVMVWLAMTALGGSEDVYGLLAFGAKYNPFIVQGQYWRLLTATFLHIGFLHLLFNGYALYVLGSMVESRFGTLRFMVLYLLSGIAGSTASFLGSDAVSAGASGAIFGIMGAIIVYFVRYRQNFPSGGRQLTNLLVVAAINLAWGMANPEIDNFGHVGGLIVGLLLGWPSAHARDQGGARQRPSFPGG
jgi:rhomboid protease GluP